ncbi:indole-3-glycerol phosphate synthase TrpC [Elizabethkingia argentiflava]|uniref:indole-3-glycerol-phosphate synthase n=1 Tax=Elizabethkingia argenteiflava TaxID=2681556 RepID=A0A845PRH6_9FLAO|nr:indole-3-glycerol phosphate synthase TrpC [Elizabethkingia argenteiflava]NAW50265.1 indole-3-glycerol phosphate synthase TrpC [Elizabethkingia argenteiflava]
MTILEKIVIQKKQEIEILKKTIGIEELKLQAFFSRKTYSLKKSIQEKNGIIAEFKRKSPSKGVISEIQQPLSVVSSYEKFGARGISILTDTPFFGGSKEDILSVREAINIPILRKDFMVDAYQFYEAKAMGADVVLLIAACLSPAQVLEFTDLAHSLQLEVLLEIHTEEELKHFNPNVDLVGINNRNLKDFKVDLQHSVNLKNRLPKDILTVAESGIYKLEDFKFLKNKGFNAFLMGEFFMKHAQPGKQFEIFSSDIAAL